MLDYQRTESYNGVSLVGLGEFQSYLAGVSPGRDEALSSERRLRSDGGTHNVRPPRYLSWFITPITMVFGTYNSSYWGL